MGQKYNIDQSVREEIIDLLGEMEEALLDLEQSPRDARGVRRVFRAIHTIKGAANMFRMVEVESLAHEVESTFDAVRSGEGEVSKPLIDLSFSVKDMVTALLDDTGAAQSDEYADLLSRLRSLSPAPAGREPQGGAPAPRPKPEAALAPSPEQTFLIRLAPKARDFLIHTDLAAVFDDLRRLGRLEPTPDVSKVPELASLDPSSCLIEWDLSLIGACDENSVRDAFIFIEDMAEISLNTAGPEEKGTSPEIAPEEPEPEPEPAPSPGGEAKSRSRDEMIVPAVEPGQSDDGSAPAALDSAPASSGPVENADRKAPPRREGSTGGYYRENSQIVKVAADKLDDLVSLVGEMVIVQSRLNQAVSLSDDPALLSVTEEMEALGAALRDRTLSMRMVPIGTTFERFRRLVRDLSRELGKEIELHTRGADTELDKTVIDQLGDPLVHLMRNAIDHGLETPEEREKLGKPKKGKIVLSAEHSGGDVLIRIIDDGRGFDREKIAAKAMEKGLIGDVSGMDDRRVFNMVFQTGFSTAGKVTSVSGRGVGMDAVRKAIDGLRGNVSIDSRKGMGACVTIALPLTLAIIEGLVSRVGEEFYVIPLASVVECVELKRKEQEKAKGEGVINLRRKVVPYLSLRKWFNVAAPAPAMEQVVIVRDGERLAGIAVDEVVGQQQAVIKSLGKVFQHLDEISGATVKGDGTMALILDVFHLLRKAEMESRG